MNDIKIFENEQFGKVRIMVIKDEPWFVGKDVAAILGYADTFGALKKHVEDEDRQNCQNDSFESPRGLTIINESGLYSLVLSSHLPQAKEFKRWVTSEVLPAIRKHGGYLTPAKVEEALLNPDVLIHLATQLKEERAKVAVMAPKALFADAVATSETSILVGELAKLIKQNGVDIGEKRLFGWLRENGYLISRKGNDWNMPTQKSMELGVMEIKERTVNNPDGSVRITKTPKVTGKGQVYFVGKFVKTA